MKFKETLIYLTTFALLLFANILHADFRKAIEAYIARDGISLLKEVKEAVIEKNDNDLMLFLVATNMDALTSDYDNTTYHYDSTLGSILSTTQWNELRDLLVKATSDSTLESQYFLNIESLQFSRELITKRLESNQTQSHALKREHTNLEINSAYKESRKEFSEKGIVSRADDTSTAIIRKQAESGEPYAQSLLGFFGVGYYKFTTPECKEVKSYAPLCTSINQSQGNDWLKKAIKTYEQNGLLNEGYGQFAVGMCNYILDTSDPTDEQALKQAYRWCILGANLGDSNAIKILDRLHKNETLKVIDPNLNYSWDTPRRNEVLFVKDIKEWPNLVVKARTELDQLNVPVFSYIFVDSKATNALEIYSDGRVFLKDMQRTGFRVLLAKISSNKLNQFLNDVQSTGINDWKMVSVESDCTTCVSHQIYMRLSLKVGNFLRRIFIPASGSSENAKKISIIKALVDKYFPTIKLRVELGKSEKIKKEVLNLENNWLKKSQKEI